MNGKSSSSVLNIDLDVRLFITPYLKSTSAQAFHLCLYYLNSVLARRGSRSARKQATQYAFLCILFFFSCVYFVSCFWCEKRMQAVDGSLDNNVTRVLCKRKPFMKLLSTRATPTTTTTTTCRRLGLGRHADACVM